MRVLSAVSQTGRPHYFLRPGGDPQAIEATATEVYVGGHFNNVLVPVKRLASVCSPSARRMAP